jgi:hypothetical protein
MDVGLGSRLADEIGDVDGVEVAGGEEAADGFKSDVVGVEEVRQGPVERLDGGIGGDADRGGFGADDVVFAVGLVPDRYDFDAGVEGLEAGLELGFGLMGEAVAGADGVLA